MEKHTINRNIKTIYITATSFPEGVLSAHQKLHELLATSEKRTFYGISWPEDGKINYKAAAEELHEGEAESLGLETFTIRKGIYIAELLTDWQKSEKKVGGTFKKLLSDPRIDENGYCLEIYLNEKDMLCLVPLSSEETDNR